MDFGKLNSMTKYPEIKTYHKMGDKGRLLPELTTELNQDQMYHVSEKVDGTNTRMVFIVDDCYIDWFIGSREEILTAKDDRISNPALDVVENIQEKCKEIATDLFMNPESFPYGIYTIYSELYGGKLPATKQYTTSKAYAIRTFDISYMTLEKYNELCDLPRDQIALWRNNGGQEFKNTDDRAELCNILDLERVPFRENIRGSELPIEIQETYNFMFAYRKSKAGINFTEGRSEGIVIRSDDRKQIVKLRFDDYERTLNIKRK
jgi:hypothetical protein